MLHVPLRNLLTHFKTRKVCESLASSSWFTKSLVVSRSVTCHAIFMHITLVIKSKIASNYHFITTKFTINASNSFHFMIYLFVVE